MSSRAWAIIGGVGSTFVRLLGWRVGFGLGVPRWRPHERAAAARELQ